MKFSRSVQTRLLFTRRFLLSFSSLCLTGIMFAGLAGQFFQTSSFARAAEPFQPMFPLTAKRILILGDSITHQGHYVSQIETQLLLRGYAPKPEIINLGLGSETCSGLSEPGHPFPRPNVQNRIDRALELIKPDVVMICYGMNDGIYYPLNEARFEAYQTGIQSLIKKVHQANAKVILLTPPPFDPVPVSAQGKLLPEGEKEYAYYAMFERYNDVMQAYGKWILQQQKPGGDGADLVIDIYSPLQRYIEERRKTEPQFTVTPDGIHPNSEGHSLIAKTILQAWGIPDHQEPDPELLKLVHSRMSLLHGAWLKEVGHDHPHVRGGLPLAEAEQKAKDLSQKIHEKLEAR